VAQEPAPHETENEAALRGVPVLVVDDNLTNRKILADMLWSWGMQPTTAASAPEALAHMRLAAQRSQPYPLVLTDVHMPEMDGFDLVERIQATPNLTGAFILMLTSGEHIGDLARCRKLGVSGYLTKPVRRAELRAAIGRALTEQTRGKKPAEAPTPVVSRPREPETSGLNILLAEDNVVNQRVARAILEKAGHRVVVADNGQKALMHCREQHFDLVLMDVQMPEMDGFEATAIIRQMEKWTGTHLPIVAMTAHAMTGDRERCLDAGMDNYITKPIHPPALIELVAQYARTPSHA